MKDKLLVFLIVALFVAAYSHADQTKTEGIERLQTSTRVVEQILNTSDKGIPEEVWKGAKCVGVVPGLIKAGFIIAGKRGRGVAACRLPSGNWSAPAFFTITGGSWGAQIGVESVDLVMMVMNEEGMRHLMSDKFQIGGEAAGALGPIGRHASAAVDWKVEAQILTYSRAKGLFAGIDLGGSWVEHDEDSTIAFYGKDLSTRAILDGEVPPPPEARPFLNEIRKAKAMAMGHAGR
jgi:SH3 domain-containing YSC84-like protein 1